MLTLPDRYDDLLDRELQLGQDEIGALRAFAALRRLSSGIARARNPETVQHNDLHMANVYAQGERVRVLDWGDSSISHPFASLIETFRFLEEVNQLDPSDPWFA